MLEDARYLWGHDPGYSKPADLSHYGKQPGRCSHCGHEELWPYSRLADVYRLRCSWCGSLSNSRNLVFSSETPLTDSKI